MPSPPRSWMPSVAHSALMEAAAIHSSLPPAARAALAPATDTLRQMVRISLPYASAPLPRLWTLIKPSLFSRGRGRALAYLAVAILANHVRRTMWPWLGEDLFHAPLGDLKLALGSPHVFLEQVLRGTSWWERAWMTGQKMGVDALGALWVGVLVEDAEGREARRRRREHGKKVGEAEEDSIRLDVARIGAVVYLLAAAEYVHARTCHTAAVVLATVKGLVPLPGAIWGIGGGGTAAHRAAHWDALRTAGPAARVFLAARVVVYALHALGPMMAGAARGVTTGRPGAAAAVAGAGYVTYAVTRWSNKYYMLLEMWGMVMVLGWAAAAGVVVAMGE